MRRPLSAKKLAAVARARRVQRAVIGIQVPMSRLVGCYDHIEMLIDQGADDDGLAQGARNYLGVV